MHLPRDAWKQRSVQATFNWILIEFIIHRRKRNEEKNIIRNNLSREIKKNRSWRRPFRFSQGSSSRAKHTVNRKLYVSSPFPKGSITAPPSDLSTTRPTIRFLTPIPRFLLRQIFLRWKKKGKDSFLLTILKRMELENEKNHERDPIGKR